MGESWMLARLRREMGLYHQAADGDRLVMMTETIAPADYISFLVSVYGFESPIIAALATTPHLESWIEPRSRTQMRLLRVDLITLGVVDPPKLPCCAGIPPFPCAAVALGWLYVVERNKLLHGLIERHLRQRLPEQVRLAGSYLTAADRVAGARWRELGDAMDRCAPGMREADQIVTAARAAFRCQHRWYEAAPHRRVA